MSDKSEWQKNLIKTRENIIRVENNSIENLKRIIQTLQQENARLREGLDKIVGYKTTETCGFEKCASRKQIKAITKIATEALQAKGENDEIKAMQ